MVNTCKYPPENDIKLKKIFGEIKEIEEKWKKIGKKRENISLKRKIKKKKKKEEKKEREDKKSKKKWRKMWLNLKGKQKKIWIAIVRVGESVMCTKNRKMKKKMRGGLDMFFKHRNGKQLSQYA